MTKKRRDKDRIAELEAAVAESLKVVEELWAKREKDE